jgi:hypothetical protein
VHWKLNLGLFPWANLTRKAQHITKKETAQHDQHESSTDLTTGSDHYFFDIFSDSVSIKEAHQFSGQFDKRCAL